MELYRDCTGDYSYFMGACTIAEKTENKVDTRASVFFQNALQQTKHYFLTRFILKSVLKRADFDINIALIKGVI